MWGDLLFGQEFHNFFTSIFWLLLAADELVLELPDLQTHCQSLMIIDDGAIAHLAEQVTHVLKARVHAARVCV